MATKSKSMDDLSSSEASAAEIISKMSEYQFIAVVQDGNACEPMEQVVNEKGEVVAINTDEYYETIGEAVPVELNFETADAAGINELKAENVEVIKQKSSDEEIIAREETIENMQSDERIETVQSDAEIIARIEREHQENQVAGNLKDMLLPLGIKIPSHHNLVGTKRKRPKSSLFIGCSPEATQVINEFDALKERLHIKTNLDMLKHMLKLEKKYLNSTVVTTECIVDDGNKNTKAILQLLSTTTTASDQHVKTHDSDLITPRITTDELHSGANLEQPSVRNEEVTINIMNDPVQERNVAPNDMTELLGLTALNVKTIQLSKKYLEHIVKEGFYISGFIDGTEKLDEFLKFFRIITGSAFSIRRSKSKINDDPEPEEKPLRKYKPGYLGKGQIKWEKNIGVPPIPFTGIPFTTEGSTTYQCVFGPKRAKMSKENNCTEEEEADLDTPSKRRKSIRESKKKDCPAQIHIRTVHRFPTYNCINNIQPVKSESRTTYVNKCQRGIILAKLREDIVNEHVHGEQGFWIRVPLPEVHQNHSLGPFDGDDPPLTEDTILEMKTLLHDAAISSS